jgi:hypothetical protein
MARFFRRGVSKVRFCPAVAGTSPTRAELNAGVNLSPSVAAMSGFTLENSPIATPDLETTFDSQIKGPDAAGSSTITYYDDDTATAVRTSQAKDTTGFMVLLPYGDVPGKRCEVWAVTSTGVNDQWGLDAAAAQFVVGYAITARPTQSGVVPA